MKGIPLEECVKRANNFLEESPECLLIYDVRESRYKGPDFGKYLDNIISDINSRFSKELPKSKLARITEYQKGFDIHRGDCGCAAINSSDTILKIRDYLSNNYSSVGFYWTVGRDGLDKKAFSEVDQDVLRI